MPIVGPLYCRYCGQEKTETCCNLGPVPENEPLDLKRARKRKARQGEVDQCEFCGRDIRWVTVKGKRYAYNSGIGIQKRHACTGGRG